MLRQRTNAGMEDVADPDLARKVETMAGYGLRPRAIACCLDVDEDLLDQQYARELQMGAFKANLRVAENLYRKATGDGREAVTASIFWLKTRAGWRDREEPPSAEETTVVIRRFAVDWEPAPARGEAEPAAVRTQQQIEGKR